MNSTEIALLQLAVARMIGIAARNRQLTDVYILINVWRQLDERIKNHGNL